MLKINLIHAELWRLFLAKESYVKQLAKINYFLDQELTTGQTIYPPQNQVFEAFNQCPFEHLKVVLLGQDPYHNPGQAHGLSFSVPNESKIPPSLKNIFKEIYADVGVDNGSQGNLLPWAKQGVLLLNTILTVSENEPGSHRKSGWEWFTNQIIADLSAEKSNLVFILWGNFAQEKKQFIDGTKHLILEGAHPSPLAAYRGFFGCQHFSKTNSYLKAHGKESIDWSTKVN